MPSSGMTCFQEGLVPRKYMQGSGHPLLTQPLAPPDLTQMLFLHANLQHCFPVLLFSLAFCSQREEGRDRVKSSSLKGLGQGTPRAVNGPGEACLGMFAPGKLGWVTPPAQTPAPGQCLCRHLSDTESRCSRFYLKQLPWRDVHSFGTEGWDFAVKMGH